MLHLEAVLAAFYFAFKRLTLGILQAEKDYVDITGVQILKNQVHKL